MLGRKSEEPSGFAYHEMRFTVNWTNNLVPESLTQVSDVVTKSCTVQNSVQACYCGFCDFSIISQVSDPELNLFYVN